jgi:hypothetical protein
MFGCVNWQPGREETTVLGVPCGTEHRIHPAAVKVAVERQA